MRFACLQLGLDRHLAANGRAAPGFARLAKEILGRLQFLQFMLELLRRRRASEHFACTVLGGELSRPGCLDSLHEYASVIELLEQRLLLLLHEEPRFLTFLQRLLEAADALVTSGKLAPHKLDLAGVSIPPPAGEGNFAQTSEEVLELSLKHRLRFFGLGDA